MISHRPTTVLRLESSVREIVFNRVHTRSRVPTSCCSHSISKYNIIFLSSTRNLFTTDNGITSSLSARLATKTHVDQRRAHDIRVSSCHSTTCRDILRSIGRIEYSAIIRRARQTYTSRGWSAWHIVQFVRNNWK